MLRDLIVVGVTLAVGFGLGVLWSARYKITRYRPPGDREARRRMYEQIYRPDNSAN